jgi:hypothetical protein
MLRRVFICAFALLAIVGCSAVEEGGTATSSGRYGSLQFGEEQIPVNTVKVSDSEEWLLVLLSPLTGSSFTTNAIVGLKKELVGSEVDVMYKYQDSDYIVVYEDPQCYYAPYRALQSGTIRLKSSGTKLSVRVDVVLFDGTPLRYSNDNLPIVE